MSAEWFKKLTANHFLSAVFILVLTAVVYSNTFKNQFIVDDPKFTVNWPMIKDLNNWPQFFGPESQPKGEEGVYSPLKTCIHALNYHWWGKNPFGYHLIALLIHLLGTGFVYLLALALTRHNAMSFLCGLLFGLHPVHVEAVTFLTASVDTLGVVFFFIAFYAYVRALETAPDVHGGAYAAAFFFALLAIFTHELTIILPLFFLLYEFYAAGEKGLSRDTLRRLAPFFILAAAYILFKQAILGAVNRGGYLYDSPYLTMLVILKAWARYIFVLFFPLNLSPNAQISPGIFSVDWKYFDRMAVLSQSIFNGQILLSVGLILLVVYIALRSRRRQPLVAFGIAWFFISLLPVSNIVPSESYFAERYLYPGSFGFCLVWASVLVTLAQQKRVWLRQAGIWIAVVTVLFFGGRTFLRNFDWKDELTFWQAEVRATPRHPVLHRDLGITYLENGKFTKARDELQKSIALKNDDPDAYFALGDAKMSLKDYPGAIESYQKGIALKPDFAEAYYNLAGLYAASGDRENARKALRKSLMLYRKQGRESEGEAARSAFDRYFHIRE